MCFSFNYALVGISFYFFLLGFKQYYDERSPTDLRDYHGLGGEEKKISKVAEPNMQTEKL